MGNNFGSSGIMGESTAVSVTGTIMLAAIIILFLVVAFVSFLHLYARWFWGRIEESTNPPPRNRRRPLVFAPGQDPATYGTERTGLEPTVLRSLPVLVFQPEEFKDGLDCAVCLSELVEGEKARLLPKCNHGFHVDCIDMWFQSHSTCPLCRNPVTSESLKSSSRSDVHENVTENMQQPAAENSIPGSSTFPTNVLIWGNQTQVCSIGASLEEEFPSSQPPFSSSSASSASTADGGININQGMLVIDIPCETNSSSLSPSGSRFAEDELKSPMTERLRSFKRLLNRDKRFSPCTAGSIDVEQAGRGQS